MKKIVVISVLTFVLNGCSWSTRLANEHGQEAKCESSGFGLLSSAYAKSKHDDCVDEYKKKGYKETGDQK